MSDGARSFVTSSPLIRPRKTPMRAETAQRTTKGAPGKKATASFTVQYMAVTPTAAKDTSSPPVTRTRKKPIAKRPITVLFFSNENMLNIEKKTGLKAPTVSARTTSTRKINTSWRRMMFAKPHDALSLTIRMISVSELSSTRRSATIAPFRITRIRSQTRISSSKSSDTTMTPTPLGGQLQDDVVDARLRADVHAHGRAIEDKHARMTRNPSGQNHALLIAAREAADREIRRLRLDREPLDPALRLIPFAGCSDPARRTHHAVKGAHNDVVADTEIEE